MICTQQYPRYLNWALQRLPNTHAWPQGASTIALLRDVQILAVMVYTDFTGSNVNLSIAAIAGKRWMTRAAVRAVFAYPFEQLGVRRVSAHIAAGNTDSQRLVEHAGFRQEGCLREALAAEDVLIYGLLKRECRFI